MKGYETVTYACGHTGEVYFSGSARDLKRLIWRCEHQICDACAEKARQEKNAASAAANAEAGLPALDGSEKQIAWAESIRENVLTFVNDMFDSCDLDDPDDAKWAMAIETARDGFFAHTSASWWIDRRNDYDRKFRRCVQVIMEKAADSDEVPAANQPELFVAGEADKTQEPVTLIVSESSVVAQYPKDEKFRSVVNSLGYRWIDYDWTRRMDAGCASPADVAAQTTNELIRAGFPVRVTDQETRQLMHTESWRPINPRIIGYSEQYRNFRIHMEPGAEEMHEAAMALPRAAERAGCIVVPTRAWDAVMDFAETYGFAISDGARKAAGEASGEAVSVVAATEKTPDLPSADRTALRHNEVLDDLLDAN